MNFNYLRLLFIIIIYHFLQQTPGKKIKKKKKDTKNVDLLEPKTHLLSFPLLPILLLLHRLQKKMYRCLTLSDISISSLRRYVIYPLTFFSNFYAYFFSSSIPSFLFFYREKIENAIVLFFS